MESALLGAAREIPGLVAAHIVGVRLNRSAKGRLTEGRAKQARPTKGTGLRKSVPVSTAAGGKLPACVYQCRCSPAAVVETVRWCRRVQPAFSSMPVFPAAKLS